MNPPHIQFLTLYSNAFWLLYLYSMKDDDTRVKSLIINVDVFSQIKCGFIVFQNAFQVGEVIAYMKEFAKKSL